MIPGVVNGLDNLLSALYSYPGGWLVERLGYKRALALFNLVAIAGYLIVALVPAWQAVLVGTFLFISWSALSLPATMTLIHKTLPDSKRTMGVSLHSLMRRIPMGVGPIVGGLLVDRFGAGVGVRLAFGGAALLAGVALVAQQRLIVDAPSESKNTAGMGFVATVRSFSPVLRTLLYSDILIRFCEQIPYAYLAIYAMEWGQGARVSAREFGLLTFVEMTVAFACYIPVAALAERTGKRPLVAITFFNFTLFPLVLLYSRSFAMLLVAFVVRGLKEFGEPARKSLILDLAPGENRASAFGAYYLLRDVVVSVAAFASGWLWNRSVELNLWVAFGCGVLGTALFVVGGGLRESYSHRPSAGSF
jgi:MFS family permease